MCSAAAQIYCATGLSPCADTRNEGLFILFMFLKEKKIVSLCSYRKMADILAKVFFACPIGNLDNFQIIKGSVVSTPPVLDHADWWPSGYCVLHITRVWSTIVSFLMRWSRTSDRSYENGFTPLS